MSGRAEQIIRDYWRVCDGGDYTLLTPLFASDAVLMDPTYGTFEGRDAIAGFMDMITAETRKTSTTFSVVEICGDESAAWSRWTAGNKASRRSGASIYRLRDGLIVFEQDFIVA